MEEVRINWQFLPSEFVSYFSSDRDISYNPNNSDRPRIIYVPAKSPGGSSFNVTAAPASESDLVGCESDKSSSTGLEIISSILMFCVLVAVVKFM